MSLCAVTGNVKTLIGTSAGAGTIYFSLNYNGPAYIAGTGLLVPANVSGVIDSTGAFSVALQGNDTISPTNTLYIVNIILASGGTWEGLYSITGTNFNINSATPVNAPSVPVFVNTSGAVMLSPSASQTITGQSLTLSSSAPLNVRGAATFANINSTIIVDGTTYAQTDVGIQAAINACPAGGTVFLPAATYVISGTITITKAINFIGAGWGANLQLAASVGAIPLLHIVPSGQVRGIRIQDCQFSVASGTPGSYVIQIDTSPGNAISLFVIEHIQAVGAFGTGGIWMNNTGGEANGGFFDGQIEHSWISTNGTGILGTLIGDSLTIARNLIQGAGIGIDVSFTLGSSTLRIQDNTINPTTAAIHIGSGAIFTNISGNEFETPNSIGTGSNGAFVDLDGTSSHATSVVDIYKNSFQIVNSSTLNALRLNWAFNTNIRDNNFGLGTAPAKDIVITANALGTRIRSNNFNAVSMANAISDSSGVGQTLIEIGGQASPDIPLVYRLSTGETRLDSQSGAPAFDSVTGANYIFDGGASPGNIALAASSGPVTTPAASTAISVRQLAIVGATSGTTSLTAPAIASGAFALQVPAGSNTLSQTVASGTSTLTANAALTAVTSQAAITTAATGALATDAIEWAYATAPGAGDSLCHVSAYVTAGNVNFVRSNPTAANQSVSAIVINWRVIR